MLLFCSKIARKNFKDGLTNPHIHFADTLHLVRSPIKEKHNALELNAGGYCKPNYDLLIKEQNDAHDAPEDVRALRKILFDAPLKLSRKNIVENSSAQSPVFPMQSKTSSTLIDEMNFFKHSTAKTPRVTGTKRILATTVKHFEEKNHEE